MNNSKKNDSPRAAALTSLLAWEKKGRYANLEVNALLSKSSMSEADRGLYTALVYGVIERAVTLDYVMAKLSSRPITEIDETTRCALRLGFYQLAYMDRIPPHAAVSETVDLVPHKAKGFVNALLRNFQRSGCRIPLPPEDDPVQRLSVEYGAPPELCRFWLDRYPGDITRALLASTIRNPPVTVRVNPLKTTVEEMLSRLNGASVHPLAADMINVTHAAHIADDIQEGLYFVQDASSRLCIRALDPKPGETVIDTCAAPGGKTISAALDMNNCGTLYAF
ncbi:MAG: 16S rRNA (cytosine(967)-C(5))-methyltransferase RsmB, partial [Clostridia bacterium]|nr:16S rRNA (cytosine(967)-C(5))-methyltransferase RsmB [Clostridia bacterium]